MDILEKIDKTIISESVSRSEVELLGFEVKDHFKSMKKTMSEFSPAVRSQYEKTNREIQKFFGMVQKELD